MSESGSWEVGWLWREQVRWFRSDIIMEFWEEKERSHWMEQEHRKGLEDSWKFDELAENY